MKCPNCSFPIDSGNTCPQCGMDTVIFKKVDAASKKLYNKGLELAKASDLNGAIQTLQKSIAFNKDNYYARNLLGLVYFETGHVGPALTEWAISQSIQKENNIANEYIDLMYSHGRTLEKLDDAAKMYNQALTYARQKSEDMAIIQLKKALELNPKLVDAYNLLALCYIYTEQKNEAIEVLKKVLQLDVQNPTAMKYYFEISDGSNLPIKQTYKSSNKTIPSRDVTSAHESTYGRYKKPVKQAGALNLAWFVSFTIGVICTAAAMYVLVIPSVISGKDNQISELELRNNQNRLSYEQKEEELNTQIKQLQESNEALQAEFDEVFRENKAKESEDLINEIQSLYSRSNYEEAVVLFDQIDANYVSEEIKAAYEELKTNVYTRAANSFYNTGRNHYNRARYDDAQESLEKSLQYADDESFVSDCLYYLGRIAEVKEDPALATEYYQKVINDYPQSSRIRTIQSRLANLQG